ncbi:unnamed protein product [Plutella xylostella]|uniref:(diamondback moth) hypothetical protein n=1 Tax=Plutella xylostella TaxID=51655 RepID=A0A8S4FQH9_PLUXY|nr:unnamed protein product [Plutella xylostella]
MEYPTLLTLLLAVTSLWLGASAMKAQQYLGGALVDFEDPKTDSGAGGRILIAIPASGPYVIEAPDTNSSHTSYGN